MPSIFAREGGGAGDAMITQDVADPKIAPLRSSERVSNCVEPHYAEEGDWPHAVDLLECEPKKAVANAERCAKVQCG